jgi:hypothetical protein
MICSLNLFSDAITYIKHNWSVECERETKKERERKKENKRERERENERERERENEREGAVTPLVSGIFLPLRSMLKLNDER